MEEDLEYKADKQVTLHKIKKKRAVKEEEASSLGVSNKQILASSLRD